MKLAADIWSLLDSRQRRALMGMLLLGLLAAFATVGGVAAVMPFLAFLADPAQIERHPGLLAVQHLLGIERQHTLLFLGGAFFLAVLLSNGISLLEIVVAEIIYSGLMLVSQAVASVLIVGLVVLVDPAVALSAVLALGAAYLFIYLVVRRRLASYGEEFTRSRATGTTARGWSTSPWERSRKSC
jgi:hypothetical protein